MRNSLPDITSWQNLTISALACEQAAVEENWTEFSQLCENRTRELETISRARITPPDGLVEVIQRADERTRTRLQRRMQSVADQLRKRATFRNNRHRW